MGIVESINAAPKGLTAQEVLRTALNLMNNGGEHWVKGKFEYDLPSGEKAYCSVGALNKVIYYSGRLAASSLETMKAFSALNFVLRKEYVSTPDYIIQFNDNPSTTWKDIKRVFEEAIEYLDRVESK